MRDGPWRWAWVVGALPAPLLLPHPLVARSSSFLRGQVKHPLPRRIHSRACRGDPSYAALPPRPSARRRLLAMVYKFCASEMTYITIGRRPAGAVSAYAQPEYCAPIVVLIPVPASITPPVPPRRDRCHASDKTGGVDAKGGDATRDTNVSEEGDDDKSHGSRKSWLGLVEWHSALHSTHHCAEFDFKRGPADSNQWQELSCT